MFVIHASDLLCLQLHSVGPQFVRILKLFILATFAYAKAVQEQQVTAVATETDKHKKLGRS